MPGLNADYLTRACLEALGFASLGEDVLIHSTAVIVGADRIALGSRVRIDPYVVISVGGGLTVGNNVHIGSHCTLTGRAAIELRDFSGLSHGVRVFSSTDDYSGESLTNPTVADSFKKVESGEVRLETHVIVGAGSVILPGAVLSEGSAVGALSLVNRSLAPWTLYAGVPVSRLRERRRDLLPKAAAYLDCPEM